MKNFEVIALDADDTLWHNEPLYKKIKGQYAQLLAKYVDAKLAAQKLDVNEIRNIEFYGFGIKSFTLSMVETAIELTSGQINSHEIQQIVGYAKIMLNTPLEVLPHIESSLEELSHLYDLLLITKGDQFEQERKIARSGIAHYFTHIEIVGEKSPESYTSILNKYGYQSEKLLMVGNSIRSDILPVLKIGGTAVHIPYPDGWFHENITEEDLNKYNYYEIEHLGELQNLIKSITKRSKI